MGPAKIQSGRPMTNLSKDQFLGAWNIAEAVYDADGHLVGTVQQQRTLRLQKDTDLIFVDQHCTPCPKLRNHPLADFSGPFHFSLRKQGRYRHYLGPDVHGLGTTFGDGFISGHGVWPRFGYNFHSWSIALSDSTQLTGGSFYRGPSLAAVIIGVGSNLKDCKAITTHTTPFQFQSALGRSTTLALSSNEESHIDLTREVLDAGRWVEFGIGREDLFQLEPRGADFILHKNQHAVGMAKMVGPMLYWETHGHQGEVSCGIEVIAPGEQQWFSLRQHSLDGRLASHEGLRFTI